MHRSFARSALTSLALAPLFAACGGGGGGGDTSQNPAGGGGPLAGTWNVTTSFVPEGPFGGDCAADVLGPFVATLQFCQPCEDGPEGCGASCDAYLATADVLALGDMGAIEIADPAPGALEFSLTGDFFVAASDLTFELSFGSGDYGILTEDGWECSADCAVYAGNALVPDPAEPGELTVDPKATPLCTGRLHMVGTRAAALTAVREAGTASRFVGRFLPREGEPLTMRLERGPARVLVALEQGAVELVLEAPLSPEGRFALELATEQERIALDGLLDGSDAAVGRLAIEGPERALAGRFVLLAD